MRGGNVVVEPLSLVFAYVAWDRGGGFGREEAAAERAAAELERRYPEGVDGLRAGYVLLRRGLVCMGFPRESGGSAVAWTGYVPRRLRLRRRAVVLRRFAESIGYACLRRGVPVELGGRVVEDASMLTPEQWDGLLASLPAEFAAAPRYLLLPRGRRPVAASGMRPVRERRRPSLAPVLSGVRRPPLRLRTLAAVNLLVALVFIAAVVSASVGQNAVAEAEVTGAKASEAGAPGTRASGGTDAAVSLGALAGALEPLSPRLRLREIRADGAALRVRGSGGDAEAVREALAASRDFEKVVTVSRRNSGFVIEARYRGRSERITRAPDNAVARAAPGSRGSATRGGATAPGTAGVRAAALLEDAGAEGLAFERVDTAGGLGAGTGYRISAEARADATAEALVGLTTAEREISVAELSLTRGAHDRWRITAVVSSGEVTEE